MVRSPRRRRCLAGAGHAAIALVLFGCGPTPDSSSGGHPAPPEERTTGAVLNAGKAEVSAPGSVTLDGIGSKLGTTGACPTVLRFFTDDKPGADAEVKGAALRTLEQNGACTVVTGQVEAPMAAGTPGSSRTQVVKLEVEGFTGGKIRTSSAEKTLTVRTPSPAGAGTASPSPSSTPSHGDDPHHPAPVCSSPAAVGAAPELRVEINPMVPVAGGPAVVDLSGSSDPDGSVARYRWDWDLDGTWDAESSHDGTATRSPAAGTWKFCVEVTDDAGNTSTSEVTVPVASEGSLRAAAPQVFPSKVGSPTWVYPEDVPGAETFGLDADDDGAFEQVEPLDPQGFPPSFEHSYTTPGRKALRLLYTDADGQSSQWTSFFDVPAADPAQPFAGGSGARAAAAAKTYTLTAALTQSQDRVIAPGEVSYADGVLSVRDAIVASRGKGKLDKAQRKTLPKRVKRGLRALYNADFVARVTGQRVVLAPGSWGIAGDTTLLARSRKDRKTRVCLQVTSDGITAAGSPFAIRGATGRAKGLVGGGFYPPAVLGPRVEDKPAGVAIVALGKKSGLSACKGLGKHLPKAKKAKKGKKAKKKSGKR